jgi:hypothetical protein
MRGALAIVMVTGVMAMGFYLAVWHADSDIFKMMLGTVIGTSLSPAINWYFGSSSGSAMKDEALSKTATAQNQTLAAQSAALAASVPAPTTVSTVNAKEGTAETTTSPSQPKEG